MPAQRVHVLDFGRERAAIDQKNPGPNSRESRVRSTVSLRARKIRASTMKSICREDFAKSEHSCKSERCPHQRERLSWLSCCGNWVEQILPLDRYILG